MPTRRAPQGVEGPEATVHPVTAFVLASVFLALLAAGQALQWAGRPLLGDEGGGTPLWPLLGEIGQDVRASQAAGPAHSTLARRVVGANRVILEKLRAVDDALDYESVVGRLLRPTAQRVLSEWLGAGNEQAYCGRDGWLFYRPDVEYVTGPGFLDPRWLARRKAEGEEWASPPQPDPRPAISRFTRELEARGIVLIVVPIPVKPTVHPGKLARSYEDGPVPINNPSYAAAKENLLSSGALVFEPLESMIASTDSTGRPPYLATDTHWRPESMELVARLLAEFVRWHVPLPPIPDPAYRTARIDISHFGDLRTMLNLPADKSVYPAETVSIGRVLGPDGTPWRPSRSADVLLLGDSFSNIYSLGSMGWGESAGFAEHLSCALGRPLDRVVQNDDGAFATRMMLRQQAGSGADRLAGKRVVIYQFAVRELAFGDWKILDP